MVIIDEPEESRKIRGIILADTTEMEKYLSEFLSDHFGETKEKKCELYGFVFNKKSLNGKIEIFKHIVDEKFYPKREKVIEALVEIKKTRNKLAHWRWVKSENENTSILRDPLNENRTPLKVDNNLLKEHERRFLEFLKFYDAYFGF